MIVALGQLVRANYRKNRYSATSPDKIITKYNIIASILIPGRVIYAVSLVPPYSREDGQTPSDEFRPKLTTDFSTTSFYGHDTSPDNI